MNTESGSTSVDLGTQSKVVDSSQPSTSGADDECHTESVLLNLPQAELRLLCSLLAREGYSINLFLFLNSIIICLHTHTPYGQLVHSSNLSEDNVLLLLLISRSYCCHGHTFSSMHFGCLTYFFFDAGFQIMHILLWLR